MDKNFYKAYSSMVHQYLINKLYAGITVWIEDDTLKVKIVREQDKINYKYSIPNISTEICYGLSSEYAGYRIEKDYRKYLINNYIDWRFFK